MIRSYDFDQKVLIREAMYCDMANDRTRIMNFVGLIILLPKALRPLWEGVLAGATVRELIDIHLQANFPEDNGANRELAEQETLAFIDHMVARRMISVGHVSFWAAR